MEDFIKKAMAEIIKADGEIKEVFAAAFLAETGIKPSECVLIQKDNRDGTRTYWFEEKQHCHCGPRK